ncbi:MAG: 50S ribosomal protein L33 [Candidatus Paceibacterota bacterium]
MATKSKKKKFIKLVCQECKKSVYFTKKTKVVEDKLQLSKFCKYDHKHTNHKEAKR